MNPGPVEEVGQTTRSLFAALAAQPAVLALLVFNVLFIGFVWWSTVEERRWREKVVELLVTTQKEMAFQLHGCVPFAEVKELCGRPAP